MSWLKKSWSFGPNIYSNLDNTIHDNPDITVGELLEQYGNETISIVNTDIVSANIEYSETDTTKGKLVLYSDSILDEHGEPEIIYQELVDLNALFSEIFDRASRLAKEKTRIISSVEITK